MSEGDQDYRSHEYIADREREAYNRARGDFEHRGGGHMPVGNGDMSVHRAKEVAANAAEHYGTQQAKAMSRDQSLRGRPTELGCTAYESYPHKELEKFVREKFDPVSVHDIGRYYHQVGKDFIEFSERLRQAAAKTERNWQGRAGDAMRAHVNTVSEHMGHSGEAAQLTANQIGLQAEAGEQARNSMPEDPDFSLVHELATLASDPNPATVVQRATEIRQQAEEAKQAHQEAARVVSTMESDFGGAAENTPRFAPPPASPDETAGDTTAGYNGTGSGGSGFTTATVGETTPSSTYAASTPNTATTPPTSGVSNTPAGHHGQPQQPSATAPAWSSGGGTGNSGPPPGVVRGPDGTNYRQDPRTGQWLRQNSANGRWAPVPPGQGVPGGGRAGGVSGGRGGHSGGRAGGYGAGGYGSGGYGSGGSGLGPGGRAGIGGAPTGGPTSGTAATSSSASGRGGGRVPMGAGTGAARDQGEDEEEHERKYVLETDEIADDLGLPRVAPPVIGATPREEGGRD
ncbi:hypothetical protein CDG81_04620 [Actinopolyspora erythraea]|uniref:PPE family domain-containing protein n=1 Tax=Actinopolyspora erythraea TaxID=414996 RepID=A0A099D2F2_9ACTN|nr:hypothetical protein [Actinopolyspora erythraea]ASU77715.1 hypothetical protein CDG81_04620 [Actinopolyspora erythraea]KGI80106.1 hypothetical protein IL38_19600 [Actinopolyspora erythraea]